MVSVICQDPSSSTITFVGVSARTGICVICQDPISSTITIVGVSANKYFRGLLCLNWSNFCHCLLRLSRTFSLTYTSISCLIINMPVASTVCRVWQSKSIKKRRWGSSAKKMWKNVFFKEMVVLRLKRIIPMILLYDANKVNLHSCSSFFCMR